MTVAQLERAVARLGFAPSIEDGGALLRDAAARALDEIAAAHPRLRTVTLWHLPSPPLYHEGSTRPLRGERTITLPEGASFRLSVTGNGTFTATRDQKNATFSFYAPDGTSPATLGGSLPAGRGSLTLRLRAEGSYRILSLAVYDEVYEGLPPDPLAPRAFELSELCPSFGALAAPPESLTGRPLCEGATGDYTLEEGRRLLLSPRTSGAIRLTYRAALPLTEEGELPVTDEEAALLPLFCAAYVYLDDDPEKASFYLARFREGLRRTAPVPPGTRPFPDRTKWG